MEANGYRRTKQELLTSLGYEVPKTAHDLALEIQDLALEIQENAQYGDRSGVYVDYSSKRFGHLWKDISTSETLKHETRVVQKCVNCGETRTVTL